MTRSAVHPSAAPVGGFGLPEDGDDRHEDLALGTYGHPRRQDEGPTRRSRRAAREAVRDARRPWRRRPAAVGALAATALVGVLAGTLLLVQDPDDTAAVRTEMSPQSTESAAPSSGETSGTTANRVSVADRNRSATGPKRVAGTRTGPSDAARAKKPGTTAAAAAAAPGAAVPGAAVPAAGVLTATTPTFFTANTAPAAPSVTYTTAPATTSTSTGTPSSKSTAPVVAAAPAAAPVPAAAPAPAPAPAAAPAPAPAPAAAPAPAPALVNAAPGRRGFLYAIGRQLTSAEIDAIPKTYGVVVLNQWDGAALKRIKAADPSVVVLMYQCLSATRTSDDATHRSGGVFPSQAAANPGWYAQDTGGNRIPWDPFPGHWQMAVWNTGYQQAWTDNVVADVVKGGWDGVLADNDMSTLSWYSGRLLSGAGSRSATDAALRDGIGALIGRAGPALNAQGKVLVPNISDGRLFPGRWASHARFGGGMEENFAHFGTASNSGWVGDWGADGWMAQTDETRSAGLTLTITRAAAGDERTLLYGYASVLVRGDADAYWVPSTEAGGGYTTLPSITQMSWPLGKATGDPVRTPSGVWTRQYEGVWVAVNPTGGSVSVTAPTGARAANGSAAGTVSLGAYSAVVLRMS